jgi:hypothetical protein
VVLQHAFITSHTVMHAAAVARLNSRAFKQQNATKLYPCVLLLQELVPHIGGAAAGLMQELLLPALLPLLDDPSTAAGAFPIAAQLVAAAAAGGSGGSSGVAAMEADGAAAAAANGNGVCGHSSAADVLLSKMDAVLDDRWAGSGCFGVGAGMRVAHK